MKKKGLNRDDAKELYKDLKVAMNQMKSNPGVKASAKDGDIAKELAAAISAGMKKDGNKPFSAMNKILPRKKSTAPLSSADLSSPITEAMSFESRFQSQSSYGRYAAVSFLFIFAAVKIAIGAMEAVGIGELQPAHATVMNLETQLQFAKSRQEKDLINMLDSRRVKLQEQQQRIEEKEEEFKRREREFSAKLHQLRQLTEKLEGEQVKKDRKRSNQLEQLANVYGSMNPKEAAQLIEQLDVTIALLLLERMPEKRIGQILATMSPERALTLTRLLSGHN